MLMCLAPPEYFAICTQVGDTTTSWSASVFKYLPRHRDGQQGTYLGFLAIAGIRCKAHLRIVLKVVPHEPQFRLLLDIPAQRMASRVKKKNM